MAPQPGRSPARYRQIARDLRARIEAGEYPVGSQLPTQPEMMKSYDAALGTVDKALGVLRRIGMVESKQGMGSFVLRQSPVAEDGPDAVRKLAVRLEDVVERLAKVEKRLSAAEDVLRDGQ